MIPLVASLDPITAISLAGNVFAAFIYVIVLVPVMRNIREIHTALNSLSNEVSTMKGYAAGQKDTYQKVDDLLKEKIAGSKK